MKCTVKGETRFPFVNTPSKCFLKAEPKCHLYCLQNFPCKKKNAFTFGLILRGIIHIHLKPCGSLKSFLWWENATHTLGEHLLCCSQPPSDVHAWKWLNGLVQRCCQHFTHGRSREAAIHHQLFPNSVRACNFTRGNGLAFSCISVYPEKNNVVLHAVTHAEGAHS